MAKFKRKKNATAAPPAESEAAPEAIKKLADYEQSQPLQLSLFGFLDFKACRPAALL